MSSLGLTLLGSSSCIVLECFAVPSQAQSRRMPSSRAQRRHRNVLLWLPSTGMSSSGSFDLSRLDLPQVGVGGMWLSGLAVSCHVLAVLKSRNWQTCQNDSKCTVSGIVSGHHSFCLMGSRWVEPKVGILLRWSWMFMAEWWLGCPKIESMTMQGSCWFGVIPQYLRLFDPFIRLCGGSCGSLSDTRNQILVWLASWMLDHARTRLQTVWLCSLDLR